MINPSAAKTEFELALYLLKKRLNTPVDLIKYWGFTGPCMEKYPDIEKITKI